MLSKMSIKIDRDDIRQFSKHDKHVILCYSIICQRKKQRNNIVLMSYKKLL